MTSAPICSWRFSRGRGERAPSGKAPITTTIAVLSRTATWVLQTAGCYVISRPVSTSRVLPGRSISRRDGRAVECTALEMRHRGNSIGGSNPSLSATNSLIIIANLTFEHAASQVAEMSRVFRSSSAGIVPETRRLAPKQSANHSILQTPFRVKVSFSRVGKRLQSGCSMARPTPTRRIGSGWERRFG